MKYISRNSSGVFEMRAYEDYLEGESESFLSHVTGANLLAIERFVPTGPESFHDARFESLLASTLLAKSTDSEIGALRVDLRLKGPYFDRHFELQYEDVASCKLEAPGPADDLLMHEVRSENGFVIHDFEFDKGKTISIVSRRIRFIERLECSAEASGSEK